MRSSNSLRLYPHQVAGVAWMMEREENSTTYKSTGAILGDEMGLGKTLQILRLITNRQHAVAKTLILVTASSLHQWIHEAYRELTHPEDVLVYRPIEYPTRNQINASKIVIVSFNSFVSDCKRSRLLLTHIWDRIVVDEAHNFCNPGTQRTRYLLALNSTFRWCGTGTPILNRVLDIEVLLAFLRAEPYCYLKCRWCACAVHRDKLIYRKCIECGCPSTSHHTKLKVNWLAEQYGHRIDEFHCPSIRIPSLILRRDVSAIVLPKLSIVTKLLHLQPFERQVYDYMFDECEKRYEIAESVSDRRNLLIVYLTILRQVVNCPQLILLDDVAFTNLRNESRSQPSGFCCVCFDELIHDTTEGVKLACGHSAHLNCLNRSTICPACLKPMQTIRRKTRLRTAGKTALLPPVNDIIIRARTLFRNKIPNNFCSSKVKELLTCVQQDIKDGTKVLIFSQFTRFLYLIGHYLKTVNISYAELTGRTKQEARLQTLRRFHADPTLKVLLVSLRSGGEALNLQSASRVYILDPWWNQGAELQAIKRSHRIGQNHDVYATRFICHDSIETGICELQEHKNLLCQLFAWGDKSKMNSTQLEFVFNYKKTPSQSAASH